MRTLSGLALGAILVAAPSAYAQESCPPIKFSPGTSQTTISGKAPADGVVCYTLTTGGGQKAVVRLLGTRNSMVAVQGVGDGQTEFAFTTKRGTYRIEVGQLMRSNDPEPFKLFVSVTSARIGAAGSGGQACEAAPQAKVTAFVDRVAAEAGLPIPRTAVKTEFVDLNGDGVPEALVRIEDANWCGARGCSAFVLDLKGPQARSLGDFTAQDMRPLATRTAGWRDISVNGVSQKYRAGRYGS